MRCGMLIVVALLVVVPMVTMNHDKQVASDIDNRMLQEAPTLDEGFKTFTKELQGYFSDRIGYRYEMVGAFSTLNDRCFNLMVHPTYEYGEDGWVFLRYDDTSYPDEFINAFASYIRGMQDFCAERGKPFLYVMSPSKTRIYPEFVSKSIGELPSSDVKLRNALDERGVNYIDLADAIFERKNDGVQVFNKVYDAGHWNTEGMYAGSQMILDKLQEMGVNVDDVDLSDYDRIYRHRTSLLAANYPIDEETYTYEIKEDAHPGKLIEHYGDNLEMNEFNTVFNYYENDYRDTPSMLMFQGSYFNSQGTILQNQFSRIAEVHDYENVIDFPYYYDIFQPDVVIFENADYTANGLHYNLENLQSASLFPVYSSVEHLPAQDMGMGSELTYEARLAVANFSFEWEGPEISAAYVRVGDKIYDTSMKNGVIRWGADAATIKDDDIAEIIGVDGATRYIYECKLIAL